MKKQDLVRVEKTETGMRITYDPLYAIKATRFVPHMDMTSKNFGSKKGKGSYRRRGKHRATDYEQHGS